MTLFRKRTPIPKPAPKPPFQTLWDDYHASLPPSERNCANCRFRMLREQTERFLDADKHLHTYSASVDWCVGGHMELTDHKPCELFELKDAVHHLLPLCAEYDWYSHGFDLLMKYGLAFGTTKDYARSSALLTERLKAAEQDARAGVAP